MRVLDAIDDDNLAARVSVLRKRQAFLRFNVLLEYLSLLATVWCGVMLVRALFGVGEAVGDLLLLGSAAAPFFLLLFSWYHQWYYRARTESVLRRIADHIIEKRKEDGFIRNNDLVRIFSEVQRAAVKCSMPLFIPVKKVFVLTWSLAVFLILVSIGIMAVKYDVVGFIQATALG